MAEEHHQRAVVDAGVLIAHLNKENGRYNQSRDLLIDAEEGRIELWAPMVIQVEVVRWSREVDVADQKARNKLDDFLDSDWLNVVEVDRRMAKMARDVVASTAVRTGVDGLYVATAVMVDASVLYSWDDRLLQSEYPGVKVVPPPGSATPRLDLPTH